MRLGATVRPTMANQILKSPVATRILLVRHGLSSFNLEGRIQGREDASVLSAAGEQQARQLGKALAELSIDAILCSPCRGPNALPSC